VTILVTSVVIVLVVSAFCSLSEAALYAVRMPYVRQLVERGESSGELLESFKKNMERPITAILILNTAANTAGAAVAGAQARFVFGEAAVVWFSAVFTLAVLFLSEIIPKVTGVAFNRPLARMLSHPLDLMIKALYPLVWLTQRVARIFTANEPVKIAPEDEVWHLAAISAEEGSILPMEAELIKNVLRLNEVTAKDIMTPRTVMTRVSSSSPIGDLRKIAPAWQHTRIPVFNEADPEDWLGFVLKEDVVGLLAADKFEDRVDSLCKPLAFVPEVSQGHILLNDFIKKRQHILGVVDEYGSLSGIVTLEDVIESLIGTEIVDETDRDADMQAVARRYASRLAQSNDEEGKGEDK
jgi:CBS domain containing-hemolysin-like protein